MTFLSYSQTVHSKSARDGRPTIPNQPNWLLGGLHVGDCTLHAPQHAQSVGDALEGAPEADGRDAVQLKSALGNCIHLQAPGVPQKHRLRKERNQPPEAVVHSEGVNSKAYAVLMLV
jgi:hypothetical protein